MLSASGVLAALGIVAVLVATMPRTRRAEADRLASLLSLREGMDVAEIGAGTGWLSVEIAGRVGASGRVYATELSRARLDDIREAVQDAGLDNVTVLEAGERTTNLSPACCDAIFMRRVYHHLSDRAAVTASIREALKPGGRLAIIEFRPDGLVGFVTRMGIDRATLVDQVRAAGFEAVTTEPWPRWDHYVAVFEKRAGP